METARASAKKTRRKGERTKERKERRRICVEADGPMIPRFLSQLIHQTALERPTSSAREEPRKRQEILTVEEVPSSEVAAPMALPDWRARVCFVSLSPSRQASAPFLRENNEKEKEGNWEKKKVREDVKTDEEREVPPS